MENCNLILFMCLFIPMSMMLLIFKGNSKLLCCFLILGMFICVLAGEINGLIANNISMDLQNISINIAPLIEEILKALPIIFMVFVFKPNKQFLAECALALGVGFATLENISLLLNLETVSFGFVFIRAIGAGIMHGICTLMVGLSMRNVIDKKVVYVSGTLSALCVAVIYHSIYNMLITSKYMIFGALLPLITFIIIIGYDTFINKRKKGVKI